MTASAAGAPALPVGIGEARQPLLEADRAPVELDRDRGAELAEQAAPRAPARHRLLRQDPLLGLGEEVRPVAAGRREVVRAEREPLVGEQLVGPVVGDGGPLELEEEDAGVDRGRALLDPLEQRAVLGVGGVDREAEARVGARPAQELADTTELLHDRDETLGVELTDLVAPLLDGDGQPVGFVELLVDAGDAEAVDEGLEVPGDVGGGPVGVGQRGQEAPIGSSASGRGAACTTVSERVARVRIT